jgi:hypothetical protein
MEGRAVMDPLNLQKLIDGYTQGSLNSADQAQFDSLFSTDPVFSEKVTNALGAHLGEPPADFVDSIANHMDAHWETLYKKGTQPVDRTLFVESGILVAALAVLVGAGWYVWKTLGTSPLDAQYHGASSPKVVLAFTLPNDQNNGWKPKKTFADAERDFTPRASSSSLVSQPSTNISSNNSEGRSLEGSMSGQILRIRVEVPRDLKGRVTLWNAQGQMVRHLFEGAMPKGIWALDWDQKNDQGNTVGSGSYSVHIEAGGQVLTGQVVVAPGH